MSYIALYRKWRPDSFENVVGQEHIVKTLTNQLIHGRLSHAYLFCGTRGTGKTSTAKIFAKAVNCEAPVNGNPCNECSMCKAINNNQSMNIIEIDAASNNGVDNIREIREEVRYTPTEGHFKVYIIDEVHMLSTGAFNALLKTLEEPPSHVIFILATTEPHKIPATILSRCQRYDFKRIPISIISDTVMKYLKEEGINAEEAAVKYVSKVADGSMRDALSILDQCIAFYLGEDITYQKVLDVLGAVDNTIFADTINALHEKDVRMCMDIIEQISTQGRDLSQFIFDIIHHLRNILLLKNINQAEGIVDMAEENIQQIKNQSQILNEDEIIYYIKAFSDLESKIKLSSQKRVLIEVAFMKLCQPSVNESYDGLIERIRTLEKKIEEGIQVVNIQESPKERIKELKEKPKLIHPDAIPKDVKEVIARFPEFIEMFSGLDKAMLKKAIPAYLEDENLYIICENEIQYNHLSKPSIMTLIQDKLAELHKKQFKLRVLTASDYDSLALANKSTTTGVEEAKDLFELIKSQINFDIKEI